MVITTDLDDESCRPVVAVTGASGHLGANLVRALLENGRRVRVLIRESSQGIDGLDVEMVRADVLDRGSLDVAFAGASTVYHLAAKVSAGWEPAESIARVNVTGTANVAEACIAAGVRRLVHFSSIQALVPRAGEDTIDETSPLVQPGDPCHGAYDISKAEAERVVLAARGLDSVIVNPTAVIGPFDFPPSPMGEFLLGLAQGKIPALVSNANHDFVDARDVAAAALAVERCGRAGQRYLLPGTPMSLVDLARRWSQVTGRPAPRFTAPMWLARLAASVAPSWARMRHRRPLFTSESLRILRIGHPVSRRTAEAELGYHPRPIEETLRDLHAWMKRVGRL
jgi:nucleoside-diphosphate-sugar epimerase